MAARRLTMRRPVWCSIWSIWCWWSRTWPCAVGGHLLFFSRFLAQDFGLLDASLIAQRDSVFFNETNTAVIFPVRLILMRKRNVRRQFFYQIRSLFLRSSTFIAIVQLLEHNWIVVLCDNALLNHIFIKLSCLLLFSIVFIQKTPLSEFCCALVILPLPFWAALQACMFTRASLQWFL